MKLFLRDQLPVLLLFGIQITICSLIYGLNEGSALSTISYVVIVSVFLYLIYVLYRYLTKREFYRRLSNPMKALDHTFDTRRRRKAPIEHALWALLEHQFQTYQNELHQYESKLSNHVTFMNQWVHQMKTPLAVIHMTIQEEDEPIFDSIREETDRLTKGLETVLYMARLESFEQDFYIELVSLHKLVNQFVRQNKRLFIRSQVFPKVEIDPQIHVLSDEKWLTFILSQLVSNAVKYSAGKGRSVTISAREEWDYIQLEVKDEGIGIPKHDLLRIFDPYFTGDNGRQFPAATGMGLYLVHEICDRLGHRVEAESELHEGTTLRLIFTPMAEDDQYRREEP